MNSYFLCVTQPNNAGDLLINRMLIEELSLYGKVFVDCYNVPCDFRSFLIGHSGGIIDVERVHGFTLKKGAILSFINFAKKNEIRLYTQSPGPLNKIQYLPLRLGFSVIQKVLFHLHIPFVRIGNCCSAAVVSNSNVVESGVDQYYVRSKASVDFLSRFKEGGVHYIPDLSFLYKKYAIASEKRNTAVVSFRNVAEKQNLFLEWINECVTLLLSKGFKVVLYHQVKQDAEFMNLLYQKLGFDRVELRKEIVWYDDFDFYSDKSIVISNRLHCLLLGAMYSAIPFAYEDNGRLVKKIQDVFISSMGDYANSYMTDSTDGEKLLNILENIPTHQSIINTIVDENASLCSNIIHSIVNQYQ